MDKIKEDIKTVNASPVTPWTEANGETFAEERTLHQREQRQDEGGLWLENIITVFKG